MTHLHDVVVLVDVDNTLLDSDRLERELRQHLDRSFGDARSTHYWEIFEALRTELGYADYLGALQRYRVERLRDPHLLEISLFLVDYPFADRLYPGALDSIGDLMGCDLDALRGVSRPRSGMTEIAP